MMAIFTKAEIIATLVSEGDKVNYQLEKMIANFIDVFFFQRTYAIIRGNNNYFVLVSSSLGKCLKE